MVPQWTNKFVSTLMLAKVICVVSLAFVCVAIGNTAVNTRVETIIDLPYGSGKNEVGALKKQDGYGPPICPEMFQMTSDHILWVIDTVNSRILSFKDGKQMSEISTLGNKKHPRLFGVTCDTILIAHIVNNNTGPNFTFQQYKLQSKKWELKKVDLPERIHYTPLTIKPYGEGLIVDIIGKQFQGNSFASVVINADGQVTAIIPDVSSIPGNDGSIWRFRVLDNTIEGELPFAIDKYDFEKNNWQFNTQGSITRRANLYKQNKEAFIRPIGVDQYGRMTIKISEGFPLSPRFIRIGNNGKIESDIRFEDFNFDPKPLTWYFPSECYQLLTDGSILALYASPDRFKIIRIIATTDKTLQ